MATIREMICNAGVSTFREFVCLGIGGGGGITINTSVTSIQEENAIMLSEAPTTTSLIEEVVAQITEAQDTESIQETTGESLDGIC